MSDYISREALIGKVEKHYCAPCKGQGGDLDGDWCRSCVIDSVLEKVRGIPAADVAPVLHGELTEHIHELLRAEQDGRLVVLPCKVGDTLWVTGRDNVPREMELEAPDIRTVCTDEDNLCMSTCNRKPDGFCAYRLRNDGADIGKTVFLTREEAEKALEARENG